MYVTLAERTFSERVRELEGLDPATSVEEIEHHIARYYVKLATHLQNYGVQLLAGGQVNGSLFTTQAQLQAAWDEESVQTRVNGLALMAPLSVSVEMSDLPAFVTDPIMRAGLEDTWDNYSRNLQRINPFEIRPALENAAAAILKSTPPPADEFEQTLQDIGYQDFLIRAGKRDPLAKLNEIAEFKRKEEAYAAQQEAARERMWSGE